jgi:hypothetical protein
MNNDFKLLILESSSNRSKVYLLINKSEYNVASQFVKQMKKRYNIYQIKDEIISNFNAYDLEYNYMNLD